MILMTALTALLPRWFHPDLDDFDPFNILEQCVLDLPINASVKRRVNATAVDEHEN